MPTHPGRDTRRFDGDDREPVALITGGDGGTGRAAARLFAHEGATLVAGHDHEPGDALVDEINIGGGKAHFVELGIVDQDQWHAAVAPVRQPAGSPGS